MISNAADRLYEISVTGQMPAELLVELGADSSVSIPSGTTLVTDQIDQNELHRIVALIADLGLSLREMQVMPTTDHAVIGTQD